MKTRRSFEHLSEEEKRIEKVKIQKDYDDKNREKIRARKKYCYLKNKDNLNLYRGYKKSLCLHHHRNHLPY